MTILNADLAAGLDPRLEEDRAIYRTRVARRYAYMRKGFLVSEALAYVDPCGAFAQLPHRELVRKIADRSIALLQG